MRVFSGRDVEGRGCDDSHLPLAARSPSTSRHAKKRNRLTDPARIPRWPRRSHFVSADRRADPFHRIGARVGGDSDVVGARSAGCTDPIGLGLAGLLDAVLPGGSGQ